jgi:hypothetical protein
MNHVSDHDLERLHLGMVKDEAELAALEEHLLWCSQCIDAAEKVDQYVDAMRVSIIRGNFDFGVNQLGILWKLVHSAGLLEW